MKKIIKQGKPKILKAICPECGCEFTFIKSDMQKELNEKTLNSYTYPMATSDVKEYVTCPCCQEKVRSWKNKAE